MAREIGIATVLNQINTPLEEGQQRVFSIGFVRKTGQKRGELKRVPLARKHSKTGKEVRKGTGGFHLKTHKTLMLDDISQGEPQPFYVGIETIIEFNGARVRH